MSKEKTLRDYVSEDPQPSRGIVWCHDCGKSQEVDLWVCLCTEWPTCHGQTMLLEPPALLEEQGDESDQLHGQIRQLVDRVDDFFEGDDEKILRWFMVENPFLGTSPVSLILDGKTERIIKWLDSRGE